MAQQTPQTKRTLDQVTAASQDASPTDSLSKLMKLPGDTCRGVASQKVMERQACPRETLKIIHDCKKRLMTQWGASQHTVLYYYSLNN